MDHRRPLLTPCPAQGARTVHTTHSTCRRAPCRCAGGEGRGITGRKEGGEGSIVLTLLIPPPQYKILCRDGLRGARSFTAHGARGGGQSFWCCPRSSQRSVVLSGRHALGWSMSSLLFFSRRASPESPPSARRTICR